jgi:hypothetical protein
VRGHDDDEISLLLLESRVPIVLGFDWTVPSEFGIAKSSIFLERASASQSRTPTESQYIYFVAVEEQYRGSRKREVAAWHSDRR